MIIIDQHTREQLTGNEIIMVSHIYSFVHGLSLEGPGFDLEGLGLGLLIMTLLLIFFMLLRLIPEIH